MTGLEIRPVRPTDRARIEAMTAEVWDGHDYLAGVFDAWLRDPGAWFQAGELGGEVVAVQRLRPIAPQVAWLEGLRVAPEHRRQGIARAMLAAAAAQLRGLGFEELRLATGSPEAIALFRSLGFQQLLAARLWRGRRLEGDEPARMPAPADAGRLFQYLKEDPALAVYGCVFANGEWALDVDAELVRRLAEQGALRVTAGGRALAAVREGWGGDTLWAYFVSGSGAALDDLLMALRFEADSAGYAFVNLWAPDGHPAQEQFAANGYDSASEPIRLCHFTLRIPN